MARVMIILEATLGGIRRHVVDLLLGLDTSRDEVTFVYSTRRADSVFLNALSELDRHGLRLVEIPMQREIRPFADAIALVRLVREVRRFRPAILHAHGAKAGALGRLAALLGGVRRIVYTPHGGVFHFSGMRRSIYMAIERFLSWIRPTEYIGVSRHSCDEIRDRLRIPSERIHLIYNGIDLQSTANESDAVRVRSSLGAESNRFLVLYPAVFLEAKGHVEFMEAVIRSKSVPDPRLLIVMAGDGPTRKLVQEMIEEHGLENLFALPGFVSDIDAYYRAADLVLLFSRAEAFGYALIEAMAYGKPVLATSVGAIPEILDGPLADGLIRTEEVSEIVQILNRYVRNPALAQRLGEAGREMAQSRFSRAAMVRSTRALYESMLAG